MGLLAVLSMLCMAAFAALSAFSFSRGSRNPDARLQGLLCAVAGLHALATGGFLAAHDAAAARAWNLAVVSTWALVLPMQLHLVLRLWRPGAGGRWLPVLLHVPAVTLLGLALASPANDVGSFVETPGGWAWDLRTVPWVPGVVFAYLLAAAVMTAVWRATARDRRGRAQAGWILATSLAALALSAGYVVRHPLLEAPDAPRLHHLLALVWASGYVVAVFRHGLLELTPSLAVDHLLGGIQDLFLLVDDTGRIRAVNARSETLLGLAPDALRDTPVSSLAVDPPSLQALLDRVRAAPGPVEPVDVALRSREGLSIPVRMAGAAVRIGAREPVGATLIAQDQRPLLELVKAERLESIGVLAGGIAHDFNNLLTAASGFLELAALEAGPGTAIRRHLDEVQRACERAVGLTREMLAFSRGGTPLRCATALGSLLRESAAFALAGSGVRLDLEVEPGLWPVDVDAGQVGRVVHNLVLNAVQAMSGSGTVRVRAWNVAGETRVRFSVSDEGPGIADELRARLFEPFYTTKAGGTGLGLAVADSVVRRHGGTLSVESRPGHGATFVVELPRAPADPAVGRGPGAPPAPLGGRVLVMDDEASIRRLAGDMLAHLGCEVETCPDGAEAVRLHREARAQGRPFATLVLDLTVPGGLGGLGAARAVRAVDREVRLVMSSGYTESLSMSCFGDHGFDAVLPKPYTLEQVRAAVGGGPPGAAGGVGARG